MNLGLFPDEFPTRSQSFSSFHMFFVGLSFKCYKIGKKKDGKKFFPIQLRTFFKCEWSKLRPVTISFFSLLIFSNSRTDSSCFDEGGQFLCQVYDGRCCRKYFISIILRFMSSSYTNCEKYKITYFMKY